jgi:hypothetical protein
VLGKDLVPLPEDVYLRRFDFAAGIMAATAGGLPWLRASVQHT